MQIKKARVKNKIVKVAKKNFSEQFYRDVSLTDIAKCADLSRGAIYTYFNGKTDLFRHLCHDAILLLETSLNPKQNHLFDVTKSFSSPEQLYKSFITFANHLSKYAESLYFLLFRSEGSPLENYRQTIVANYIHSFKSWLTILRNQSTLDLSTSEEMIINTLATIYVSYIEQIVLHRPESSVLQKYARHMSKCVYHYTRLLI